MEHLRWEKHGRTLVDESGKHVYKSSVGQHNVDLGNGDFAPYVWDSKKKIARFADHELRLTASGVEMWHGEERLSTLSFNPEVKEADWTRNTPLVNSLEVKEIDNLDSKTQLEISYKLTTKDAITDVSIRAGYNAKVNFGTKIKALKTGEQRVNIDFDEALTPVERRDREGNVLPATLLKGSKSWWAWREDEEHEVKKTDKTNIFIANKLYALNETKEISPDTWGTDVGIAATADDGYEMTNDSSWNPAGYLSQFDEAGFSALYGNLRWHSGLRWTGITLSGTVDTAYIDTYVTGAYSSGTPAFAVQAWDMDNAGQFSSANRPSNVTRTTASVAWTPAITDGWKTSPNLNSIVQEILDSYGLSNDAINFTIMDTRNTSNHWVAWEDYGYAGTNESELSITYTPSSNIKTVNGLAKASVKTVNGLAIASVKTINGLT